MKLDKVLTPSDVAALAGWSRRRMLRHLLKLDARSGGQLLVNVGTERWPRWTVTLGALKSVAPQWFIDEESLEARLTALEERVAVTELKIDLHTERLARS